MLRSEWNKVKLEKRLNTFDRSNWTKHFLSLLSLSKIPLNFRYRESERTEKRKREKRNGLVYVREYALLGNVFDGWDDIWWFHGWECATWSVVPAKEDASTRAASRKERVWRCHTRVAECVDVTFEFCSSTCLVGLSSSMLWLLSFLFFLWLLVKLEVNFVGQIFCILGRIESLLFIFSIKIYLIIIIFWLNYL